MGDFIGLNRIVGSILYECLLGSVGVGEYFVIIVAKSGKINIVSILIKRTNIECKRLKLLNKYLEGLRNSGSRNVLTLNNSLVSSATSVNIVGLDREYLLKRVSSSVSLKCPNLHLSETLSAELSLTSKRLLSYDGVRSVGTCVDLIVYKVVKLEVVHYTYGNGIVKGFTGSTVIKYRLTVNYSDLFGLKEALHLLRIPSLLICYEHEVLASICVAGLDKERLSVNVLSGEDRSAVACHTQALNDVSLISSVKYGSHDLPAKLSCGNTKVYLKNLTYVHSGRNSQGVKNYIKRRSVCKERHILGRKNAGNDTLVSVTSCHLISYGDLTLLCNINSYYLVNACGEIVIVLTGEYLYVNNDTGLTVGQTKRSISYFSCLLTENSSEQSFLCGKLGLSLRSDLTYKNIACSYTEMARRACAGLANVQVISSTARLIDLVDELGADVIVKGVRNEADYAYEQKHALYNRAHNPRAETLYLPADPSFDHVSSTLVREKLAAGASTEGILPAEVAAYIREREN